MAWQCCTVPRGKCSSSFFTKTKEDIKKAHGEHVHLVRKHLFGSGYQLNTEISGGTVVSVLAKHEEHVRLENS